jgi:hypothetical protein
MTEIDGGGRVHPPGLLLLVLEGLGGGAREEQPVRHTRPDPDVLSSLAANRDRRTIH